jgi:hypothetical protein
VVEILAARRIVAAPAALDAATWPPGMVTLRLSPDEVLVLGDGEIELGDRHAIIEPDGGFSAIRTTEESIQRLLAAFASWGLPAERPCLAQGMVAGLPVKVHSDGVNALLLTPTPFAHELEARLR